MLDNTYRFMKVEVSIFFNVTISLLNHSFFVKIINFPMFDALTRYRDIYYIHFPKEKELIDMIKKNRKTIDHIQVDNYDNKMSLILHNIKIVE